MAIDLGRHSKYNITITADVSVDNNYSSTQSKVTIKYTANIGNQTEVLSSGVMVWSRCDGQDSGYTSIVGNKTNGVYDTSAGNPYTVTHTFYVNKGDSARSISYQLWSYESYASAANNQIATQTGTLSISAKPVTTYWTDINAYNPDGVQDNKSAYFDLQYSDEASLRTNLTNEPEPALYKPYGTLITIYNIRPYYDYYELSSVTGATNLGNGSYRTTVTSASQIISINMKYKSCKLTFDPNGGVLKNPGANLNNGINNNSVTVTYGIDNYSTMNGDIPSRQYYTFLGWYDENDVQVYDETGKAVVCDYWNSSGQWVSTSDLTVYAHWEAIYTSCECPTDLYISDNNDNTVSVSCKVGNNGIENASTGVVLYITYDDTTPTYDNYNYTTSINGTALTRVGCTIALNNVDAKKLTGNYSGQVKVAAKTIGTQSGYDSTTTGAESCDFTYYSSPTAIRFIRPAIEMTHAPHDFKIIWESSSNGINNPLIGYELSVVNEKTNEIIYSQQTLECEMIINSSNFDINNTYIFKVQVLGTNSNFNSNIENSSKLNIIDLEPFSDLQFTAEPGEMDIDFFNNQDGYLNVLHIDNKVNRELLRINWDKPVGKNNEIDNYNIYLKDQNGIDFNQWTCTLSGISINNELILKESIESLYKEYILQVETKSIYTDEYQNYDNISEFIFRVYPASGMYLNINKMFKRAIGFKRLDDGSWVPLRDLYHHLKDGRWVISDISTPFYVIPVNNSVLLIDINNNFIVDDNNVTVVT